MPRLTITEFARRLGISVCTVNKALSGKPKVSEATRQRVIAEAARLGYRPNRMAQGLARNPVRLAYVHPAHFESFFGRFEAGVALGGERLADHNVTVAVCGLKPAGWDKLLLPTVERLAEQGLSGLILSPIAGVDYQPVWDLLAEKRIPLVQLGLEVPDSPAALTVRQDTLLSGRIAAELLAHFPGPAAVMIGDRQTVDHAEKLCGFESEAAKRGLRIAAIYEHHDDRQLGYAMTRRMFEDHPDVQSLYVATDNFAGVHRALKERAASGRIKVVATGVFREIRTAMDQGLVHFSLDQRMTQQGELAVQHLHDLLSGRPLESSRVIVPPHIATRSNIELLAAELPARQGQPGNGLTEATQAASSEIRRTRRKT